jgi:hypothetical protein
MSDFQRDMNRAVEEFVAHVTQLARQVAVETLASTFGGPDGRKSAGRAAVVAPAAARPRGTRGAKRTAEDLEALAGKLAAFVKSNPGLRIEQINKELGTTTKDLALPIRKLIGEGIVATKGQKRSTAYFPGKKAGKN